MKSKKKKNKQNILIAYNKSIASMQGIELAMLFCHAGFSVKTILLDGAEEQISSELLKEITGHAPWSKLHKPNWVKAEIKYPVGIVIEPTEGILNPPSVTALHPQCSHLSHRSLREQPPQSLRDSSPASRGASEQSNDGSFAEYIKEHCEFIKILVNKESALNQQSDDVKNQIILLPDNPLNLRSLFEKILSESVVLTAAKALDSRISYYFEGDFSKIDYVKDLEKAFAKAGIEEYRKYSLEKIPLNPPLPNGVKDSDSEKNENNNWIATPSANPRNDDVVAVAPHCIRNATPSVFCFAKDSSPINGGASPRKEIEIVFEADEAEIQPTKNRIYVSKHKNGLLLIDSIETRLLPDFSCQSCYSRLVNYLKVELTRLDY